MLVNGRKMTYKQFHEHMEYLSELGFKFKRIPSYNKDVIVFRISQNDDIINTSDLIVEKARNLNKLFSFSNNLNLACV